MASTSGAAPAQEYKVRVSRPAVNKRFSIMKFNANLKLDLAKDGPISMERENNLKQYKNAHDVDIMPKFGAGSEFGREQKDEARRKKFGIIAKRYDPNAQPWLMKAGKEKIRNFKGTREGSVSENTSYFIFTQCADGAFEAYPIEDWYTFNPVINYKYLNSDEAEEVFEKRDKTFNFFNVMLKKRLKNEQEDTLDAEEGETKVKGKGKAKKDLMLTELEDWSDSEAENEDSDSDSGGEKKPKKPQNNKKNKKKQQDFRRKNSKKNDLDEAIEESDEGDYDDKEMDYITDNSSESETETKKNYDDGGVEDEDGLRKINESGGETDEEEEKKEEENPEKKEEAKRGSDSESSGPSSGSDDSDPEEASEFTSALFMTNKKEKKSGSKENSASNSRSSTPVNSESSERLSKKRKATDSPVVPAKKPATSSTPEPRAPPSPSGTGEARPAQASPPPSMGGSSDGLSEENIRRYLMRKPMTTKELLQKFKSKTSMTNDQLVTTLGQMLKKLNPEKKMVKEKMYLSMKK